MKASIQDYASQNFEKKYKHLVRRQEKIEATDSKKNKKYVNIKNKMEISKNLLLEMRTPW